MRTAIHPPALDKVVVPTPPREVGPSQLDQYRPGGQLGGGGNLTTTAGKKFWVQQIDQHSWGGNLLCDKLDSSEGRWQ
jgi:hypothetical protein